MTETPELSIYEKAFVKTDKTDAVLVVGGKKLHVNKALLSYHSDYFNTLFNSEFKEKSMEEIEIKDVEFEDFATLLSLVHGTPLEIKYYNVGRLLKLADQFLLRASKLHIERFIISSADFNRRQKLVLADKYNLENLLEHAIKLYNSRSTFHDFYNTNNTDISDELRLKIFDKFFNNFAHSLA
ncbi:unnamed protein product [Caenorhabditis brenneri]